MPWRCRCLSRTWRIRPTRLWAGDRQVAGASLSRWGCRASWWFGRLHVRREVRCADRRCHARVGATPGDGRSTPPAAAGGTMPAPATACLLPARARTAHNASAANSFIRPGEPLAGRRNMVKASRCLRRAAPQAPVPAPIRIITSIRLQLVMATVARRQHKARGYVGVMYLNAPGQAAASTTCPDIGSRGGAGRGRAVFFQLLSCPCGQPHGNGARPVVEGRKVGGQRAAA